MAKKLHEPLTVEQKLLSLSEGWDIYLSWLSHTSMWILTIRGIKSGSVHVYYGISLERLISAAHEGRAGGAVA